LSAFNQKTLKVLKENNVWWSTFFSSGPKIKINTLVIKTMAKLFMIVRYYEGKFILFIFVWS
jgi:hypothetical protein